VHRICVLPYENILEPRVDRPRGRVGKLSFVHKKYEESFAFVGESIVAAQGVGASGLVAGPEDSGALPVELQRGLAHYFGTGAHEEEELVLVGDGQLGPGPHQGVKDRRSLEVQPALKSGLAFPGTAEGYVRWAPKGELEDRLHLRQRRDTVLVTIQDISMRDRYKLIGISKVNFMRASSYYLLLAVSFASNRWYYV
jgi:hypothetical protein